MTSYFSGLVDFVHAHSQYTHIAIFLLALSEAIPVVGTVVPGSMGAYKDVGAVVAAAERAGLARRVARLRPLICVKG
jgi:RNA-splicing ligase RtcB